MGLRLRSPLLIGASSLTDDLDPLCRCVDEGAGAVVMRSLFEEEIRAEEGAEARPEAEVFRRGVAPYLARLQRLRRALPVPVIASLNGVTAGGWVRMARDLEDAGAEAIELNLYESAASQGEPPASVEDRLVEVARGVVDAVRIPVAVKLTQHHASLLHTARRFEEAGVRGLVLFNRLYRPDIDLETLALTREIRPSSSDDLPPRLHGIAGLHGRVSLPLACSGGVHTGDDAMKAILAGAEVVQCVSAVLRRGPGVIGEILGGLRAHLLRLRLSLGEARGRLSLASVDDAGPWERLHYARLLKRPPPPR
jgi:dihydroorotate dehydrogenase (fumarate)